VKYVLSAENIDRLAQLAWSRVLLAFDFDGTLAPIVKDRTAAAMRPLTRRLLARVCEQYSCAIISGRSRADVRRRLGEATPRFVVGNHGMESGATNEAARALITRTRIRLEAELGGRPGIEFENKQYSLSIHYRAARRKGEARSEIARAISRLALPIRTIYGKSVLDILPAAAPHKGDALLRLRSEAGMDTALFVGDDLTDEDIFTLDQPGRLLTIRIGPSRTSSAAYFLRSQLEIDDLLDFMSNCRAQEARP
jgi:trehalose 6-phosphate phosphatase